jgi:two-component system sensor histidine kinase YesM
VSKLTEFWQFTFYRRVQILLILFILLPILVVTIISYFMITQEVTERIRESNAQVVRAVGVDLSDAIDDVTFVANYLANDVTFHDSLSEMQNMKRLESFSDYMTYQRMMDYFDLIDVKMLDLRAKLFVVNANDFIISSANYSLEEMESDWISVKDRIDYNETGTMQWLGRPDRDQAFGDYMVARVIRHRVTHDYLGTLVVGLPKAYFDETFQVIAVGQVMLYDRNNDVIAHRVSEQFDQERIAIREVQDNSRNWKIVHEISSDEVTGRITNTFYVFGLYVIGCMILFLIISIVLAKRLNRPLSDMMRVAEKFGSGNLTVRFHAKDKDEFSVLGGAFNTMLDQIESLIVSIENEQEEKRVIELQALFAQIRPHFLINTLNSMKLKMVLNGDQQYSRGLDSLMGLLRAYMRVHEPWTLQEECRMIEQYMEIMHLRTDHAVSLKVELDDALQGFSIPRLLLQPIVENAIVHGFSERDSDAVIVIRAAEMADERIDGGDGAAEVLISVSDNGKGMSESECEMINRVMNSGDDEVLAGYDRVGLINIVQRVRLTYGKQNRVEATRNADGGVTFTLRIAM